MSQLSTSTSSTLDRKSLKRPDNFVISVRKGFEALFKNKPLFYTFTVGGLLLIAAAFAVSYFQEEKETKARNAFFTATQTFENEMKTLIDAKKEKDGTAKKDSKKEEDISVDPALAIQYQELNVEESFPKTLSALKKVTQEHAGTHPSFLAHMTLGKLYTDHQNYSAGTEWFEKAKGESQSSYDKVLALKALGTVYENQKDFPKAYQAYGEALSSSPAALKATIMMSVARVQNLQGKNSEAIAIYDQVIKEFAESSEAKTAKLLKMKISP